MRVGQAFRIIASVAIRLYATYRVDWAIGFIAKEFIGKQNLVCFLVHNLARVTLLPALTQPKQGPPDPPKSTESRRNKIVGIPALPRRGAR